VAVSELTRLGFDPRQVSSRTSTRTTASTPVLRLPDLQVRDRPRSLSAALSAGSDVPQQPVAVPVAGPAHRRQFHARPDVAPPHPGAADQLQLLRRLPADVHEVDYWATDAIPEDSRFYWKSFFRYSGQFRAEPLFMPIYGDAVRARSYPRSLVEQYTQIRRWAWGVTDIPFFIDNALSHHEIPLRERTVAPVRPLDGPHQLGGGARSSCLGRGPAGCPEPDLSRSRRSASSCPYTPPGC
jgi:hypothetical protein